MKENLTEDRRQLNLMETIKESLGWKIIPLLTAFILVIPFLICFLFLWGILGLLFTLPSLLVSVSAIVIIWSYYFIWMLPEHTWALIDWPIVCTIICGTLYMCKQHQGYSFGIFATWTLYCILRRSFLGTLTEEQAATADAIVGLSITNVLWVVVASQHLWMPASEEKLEAIECLIYKCHVLTNHHMHKVAGLGTVHVPYCGPALPPGTAPRKLVLIHGYMAGNAFWATNLHHLAEKFDVYAIEWKGIGRSERPSFHPKTNEDADAFYVDAIENWRKAMQMERFILCGHSMGGIYATYYAEKHSEHIEHLLLVSPAGVGEPPFKSEQIATPWKILSSFFITPMSIVRFAGPFGPRLVRFVIEKRISWVPPTNVLRTGAMSLHDVSSYSYHNWALKSSGDRGLHTHLLPGAYCMRPLCEILTPEQVKFPVTFLYGGDSDWMNSDYGVEVVRRLEKDKYAVLRYVPLAGHQVFMDSPAEFNRMVIEAIIDCDECMSRGSLKRSLDCDESIS